jgi:hypothetical protein
MHLTGGFTDEALAVMELGDVGDGSGDRNIRDVPNGWHAFHSIHDLYINRVQWTLGTANRDRGRRLFSAAARQGNDHCRHNGRTSTPFS